MTPGKTKTRKTKTETGDKGTKRRGTKELKVGIDKCSEVIDLLLSKPGIVAACYSRFGKYSLFNQALLMLQFMWRGEPLSPVATLKKWNNLGRKVKPGEKAFYMLVPIVKFRWEKVEGNQLLDKSDSEAEQAEAVETADEEKLKDNTLSVSELGQSNGVDDVPVVAGKDNGVDLEHREKVDTDIDIVRRGSDGALHRLVPMICGFKYKSLWFSLNQTEWKDKRFYMSKEELLEKLSVPDFGKGRVVWDADLALKNLGVSLSDKFEALDGNIQGYVNMEKRTLFLNPLAGNPVKTYLHELAHVIIRDNGYLDDVKDLHPGVDLSTSELRALEEACAETIAYIVGDILGLTTKQGLEHTRGYVNNWLKKSQEAKDLFLKMVPRITTAAEKLLRAGMPVEVKKMEMEEVRNAEGEVKEEGRCSEEQREDREDLTQEKSLETFMAGIIKAHAEQKRSAKPLRRR